MPDPRSLVVVPEVPEKPPALGQADRDTQAGAVPEVHGAAIPALPRVIIVSGWVNKEPGLFDPVELGANVRVESVVGDYQAGSTA